MKMPCRALSLPLLMRDHVRGRTYLERPTDLLRYSLGLDLPISGNSAEAFLYLAANVSGGPAHTILIHG